MMWEGAKKFYHESINSAKRKGVSARIVRECANLINRIPLKKKRQPKNFGDQCRGGIGNKICQSESFFCRLFLELF